MSINYQYNAYPFCNIDTPISTVIILAWFLPPPNWIFHNQLLVYQLAFVAVFLWLFSSHFPTFQSFAEVENVLVVADGFHGRLAFAFQGEVY